MGIKNKIIGRLNRYANIVKNLPRSYELKKISRIPRFKETDTNIFGKLFVIADSASFVPSYKEIFIDEIYKFKTDKLNPYIIDCGANAGVSILYFKKLYPESQIIGFEPDKKIFNILQKNVKTFGLDNVTLFQKAVWNTDAVLPFYSEGADGGRIAGNDNLTTPGNTTETISLIHFLNKEVDFLKIDIEGAEDTVIKDIEPYLKNVKNLFIEYHSFSYKNQTLHDILSVLSNAGFRYYIQNATAKSKTPFVSIHISPLYFDNQINIFAYRKSL